MTTREKLEHMLFEKGMFVQQASKVMDAAIPIIDAISDEFKISWDSDCEDYSEEMYEFLWSIVKKEALVWIDNNVPKVWFRENFI